MEDKKVPVVPETERPKKKKPSRLRALIARLRKPKPLYRRWWLIVLVLLLFPPVGIPLLWIQKKGWPVWLKLVLSVLSAAMLVWAVIMSSTVTI